MRAKQLLLIARLGAGFLSASTHVNLNVMIDRGVQTLIQTLVFAKRRYGIPLQNGWRISAQHWAHTILVLRTLPAPAIPRCSINFSPIGIRRFFVEIERPFSRPCAICVHESFHHPRWVYLRQAHSKYGQPISGHSSFGFARFSLPSNKQPKQEAATENNEHVASMRTIFAATTTLNCAVAYLDAWITRCFKLVYWKIESKVGKLKNWKNFRKIHNASVFYGI
jgi:hypothetical protein